MIVSDPFVNFEGSRANRLSIVSPVRHVLGIAGRFWVQSWKVEERQVWRIKVFEFDHSGERIGTLNRINVSVACCTCDADAGRHARLPSELDVLTGERLSVRPDNAIFEFVSNGLAIGIDATVLNRWNLFREQWHTCAIRYDGSQSLSEKVAHFSNDGLSVQHAVQRGRRLPHGHCHFAAASGAGRSRRRGRGGRGSGGRWGGGSSRRRAGNRVGREDRNRQREHWCSDCKVRLGHFLLLLKMLRLLQDQRMLSLVGAPPF